MDQIRNPDLEEELAERLLVAILPSLHQAGVQHVGHAGNLIQKFLHALTSGPSLPTKFEEDSTLAAVGGGQEKCAQLILAPGLQQIRNSEDAASLQPLDILLHVRVPGLDFLLEAVDLLHEAVVLAIPLHYSQVAALQLWFPRPPSNPDHVV